MNLSTLKQTEPIILFALAVALLGGVGYGGYRYWQSRQVVSEPQGPQEPVEEKAYEITDNPDSSKTYYAYLYNYKITVPEGWEVIPSTFYTSDLSMRRKDAPAVEDLFIRSRPAEKDRSFEKYLEWERQNIVEPRGEEVIPQEPNFGFSGIPAYRYERYLVHARDVSILVFEHGSVWYEISIPLQFKEDPEYWSILNTFEFLEK